MKILLIGEASFVHYTLKRGLQRLGHSVTLMSDGNKWHNAPRDIDVRRDMAWGKLGGLKVLWTLLRHLPRLVGNDVVQVHNSQFVPLKGWWNVMILKFLKRHNRCVVKGCYGDDPQIIERQLAGVPRYSDLFWLGKPQNLEQNRSRIDEMRLPDIVDNWRGASALADALVACLYEYYLDYDVEPYKEKLFYVPLPMELPPSRRPNKPSAGSIKVLVGVQPDRDYLKGAARIKRWVDEVARRNPGRVEVKQVENVPYADYCAMLDEADVLVDQLYSFTPSMNSLAAMARGTVVIGGGEEDFYRFMGEEKLRPIVNVSPERSGEENIQAIEKAFFTPGVLARMSQESVQFVEKYHSHLKVAMMYENLYRDILDSKK